MPHTRGRRAASSIARVQRPLVVAADHDEAVAAAERRGDGRDQPLTRLERGDVDASCVDETLDEPIRRARRESARRWRRAARRRCRGRPAAASAPSFRSRDAPRGWWRPRRRPASGVAGTMTRAATTSARPSPLVSRVRLSGADERRQRLSARRAWASGAGKEGRTQPSATAKASRRTRLFIAGESYAVRKRRQNKRAPRYCDAPLLHWSGSPSIHGALP